VAPEDAADIVQEVFTAVARSADTFQRRNPSDSFRAWLATIARNKIRDHFRRQRDAPAAKGGTAVQQQLQQLPEPDEPEEASQVESLLSHRALELVRVEFEERTWQAFWRTGVDGEFPADVAEDLGMSVFAVYQAKSRVLRRLRRELAELGD
jgi:RNA polymerase sigma-70 factor (ECF subfamily)